MELQCMIMSTVILRVDPTQCLCISIAMQYMVWNSLLQWKAIQSHAQENTMNELLFR